MWVFIERVTSCELRVKRWWNAKDWFIREHQGDQDKLVLGSCPKSARNRLKVFIR